ncbi:MAG: hypothetical protein A2284_13900, partial [Deltaproteobacteria bacterium RIFOXYA12_FULL_61_11]
MRFDELELSPGLQRALTGLHYEDLTPIQEATFQAIMAGRDLIGLAETGSGKTAACVIPLLSRLGEGGKGIRALVLVPTRELAIQYVDEIGSLGRYVGIAPFAVFGGTSMSIQRAKFKDGVDVLVATPGRLIDLMYAGDVEFAEVDTVVLDEADEMLKMGFVDDVRFILSCVVRQHQTLLFSATMLPEVSDLAESFLRDPIRIELNAEQRAPQSLIHSFKFTTERNKLEAVAGYLKQSEVRQAIVFCNSRHRSEQLYDRLSPMLEGVVCLHGGMDQARRTSIFTRFKRGEIRILLATDVAGRGLD